MLITTKKYKFSEQSQIKANTYYAKGKYCFYFGTTKGISIEQTFDILFKGNKAIVFFEMLNIKRAYIIFANMEEKQTIVFDMEEKSFTWYKISSILKTVMLKEELRHIFMLKDIGDAQYLSSLNVPIEHINEKEFARAQKKATFIKREKTYLFRYIIMAGMIITAFVIQYFSFGVLNNQTKNDFKSQITELQKKKQQLMQEQDNFIKKINSVGDKEAQSIKEVLLDIQRVGM